MTFRPLLRFLALVVGLLVGAFAPAHAQIEELPRPDSAHAGSFGVSVALGDSTAAVGVSGEAVCGRNAGAVYVYERVPRPQFDGWRVAARLTPRTCRPNAFFGEHVVLSGGRLLVSASSEYFADERSNAAYVFERDAAGRWRQTARLTGEPGRREGLYAAGIDLDGTRAVVSTSGNPEGDYGGAVYVYDYDPATATWTQSARLTSNRGTEAGIFGQGVALDGDRLAVAASTYFERDPGSVYVFRREPGTDRWRETAFLPNVESFLIDVDLSQSVLLVGEDRAGDNGAGRATLYAETPTHAWERVAILRPAFPYESGGFGATVSVDGPWALVTGYDEQLDKEYNIDRVVYVFRRGDARTWSQHTILDVGEVDFGAALDQNGSMVLVSSVPAEGPGAVYVVRLR
jgi:hypothetical protein